MISVGMETLTPARVTLRNTTDATIVLPLVGKRQVTLKPKTDTEMEASYFHAVGGDLTVNGFLGDGSIVIVTPGMLAAEAATKALPPLPEAPEAPQAAPAPTPKDEVQS